jgi:hypothetical protein
VIINLINLLILILFKILNLLFLKAILILHFNVLFYIILLSKFYIVDLKMKMCKFNLGFQINNFKFCILK